MDRENQELEALKNLENADSGEIEKINKLFNQSRDNIKTVKSEDELGVTDELRNKIVRKGGGGGGNDNHEWVNIEPGRLPGYIFYPDGTNIYIRSATIAEIQKYSTMDVNNLFDVNKKIYDIIVKCVKMEINGEKISSRNLNSIDRLPLIFWVRKLSMSKGVVFNMPYSHDDCGHTGEVALEADWFTYDLLDDKLFKYYDNNSKRLLFTNKKTQITYEFAPPKIGLEKDISDYGKIYAYQNKLDYLENMQPTINYMLYCSPDKFETNEKEIENTKKKYEKEFDGQESAFIDQVITKLSEFGLLKVKHKCGGCGMEICSIPTFPDGFKSILQPKISSIEEFLEGFDNE